VPSLVAYVGIGIGSRYLLLLTNQPFYRILLFSSVRCVARCDALGPLPSTARVESGSPWLHSLPRSCHRPRSDVGCGQRPIIRARTLHLDHYVSRLKSLEQKVFKNCFALVKTAPHISLTKALYCYLTFLDDKGNIRAIRASPKSSFPVRVAAPPEALCSQSAFRSSLKDR
jgi:hypothetical protein